MKLVINGALNLSADRERLQKDAVKAQLLEAGLTSEELESKGAAWEQAIAKRYNKLPEKLVDKPEPTSREQYLHIASGIKISDQLMLELSEQRAIAVKAYLINESGMAVDRAVVGKSDLDKANNQFSGVLMSIES